MNLCICITFVQAQQVPTGILSSSSVEFLRSRDNKPQTKSRIHLPIDSFNLFGPDVRRSGPK
jgi:hypothetical protein